MIALLIFALIIAVFIIYKQIEKEKDNKLILSNFSFNEDVHKLTELIKRLESRRNELINIGKNKKAKEIEKSIQTPMDSFEQTYKPM